MDDDAESLALKAFMTTSLRSAPWGERVARVLAAAVQAVDPAEAVRRFVHRGRGALVVAGKPYNLEKIRHIYLVGAGKAGAPMTGALSGILADRLAGGIVVVKEGYAERGEPLRGDLSRKPGESTRQVEILEAGHPIPDTRGEQATRRMIELLDRLEEDDLVFCLISGGGSALMTRPAPGVRLDDLQELTSLLLRCGATINEINTLRKHLDEVKGGKLARLAAPAPVITLILSDVVGDPLDVIASGPTVPDLSTFESAWEILERYRLLEKTPPAILAHLQQGLNKEIPETPKEADPAFEGVQNVIVGNNLLAARAALAAAEAEGLQALLLTAFLQGEARYAGRLLGAVGRQFGAAGGYPLPRPACLIAGGETTVTLAGNGVGGRNQEMALGAVKDLAGLRDVALLTLATDGGDGPTDAAGAVVTGETLRRAQALGMDPREFLARNDSYHFFEALGDLLKPGPTRTNVNDLAFVFAF
jgi:hydroxypyruvate reductase